MQRWIGVVVGVALAGIAWGQSFSIRSPRDGQVVRETVAIRIPKESVGPTGYIGIYVNGKFLEAVRPAEQGRDLVYQLDTKARGIADGRTTIKAVLFEELQAGPRRIDETSVVVRVDNSASIRVPQGGFRLRYNTTPGLEYAYDIEFRQAVSTISEAQNRAGGRAAELPLDSERFGMLYSFENQFRTNQGIQALVRMQALPERGKDYAWLSVEGGTPRIYREQEMARIFMRVTDTGREVYGAVPVAVQLEGGAGSGNRTDLFRSLPLPVLPERPVKPGDRWQARIQLGRLDLDNLYTQQNFTQGVPGRGEFVGVEWMMGIPSAKIRYTISMGGRTAEGQRLRQSGAAFADDRVEMTQTIWFALNQRAVLRSVLDISIDRRVEDAGDLVNFFGSGGGSGANSGAQGGREEGGNSTGGLQRGPGGGSRGRGGVGPDDDSMMQGPDLPVNNRQAGAAPPPPSQGDNPPANRGNNRMNSPRRGGQRAQAQFVRIRQQVIQTIRM